MSKVTLRAIHAVHTKQGGKQVRIEPGQEFEVEQGVADQLLSMKIAPAVKVEKAETTTKKSTGKKAPAKKPEPEKQPEPETTGGTESTGGTETTGGTESNEDPLG